MFFFLIHVMRTFSTRIVMILLIFIIIPVILKVINDWIFLYNKYNNKLKSGFQDNGIYGNSSPEEVMFVKHRRYNSLQVVFSFEMKTSDVYMKIGNFHMKTSGFREN